MKICILHRYPPSEIKGTNPSFLYFLKELAKRNHKVLIVTFSGKINNYGSRDLEFCPLNIKFNRANNIDKWIKSLLFIFISPFKVRNLNLHHTIDIVYCDDSLPFYPFLVKFVSGIQTVMRLGDLQTAYIFYDRGRLGKLIYRFIHWFEKFTWEKIDGIIAISKSFREFLIKEGIKQNKISVVNESIDIEAFCKKIHREDIRLKFDLADVPIIMFHGLVSRIKGLDILLKAAQDILKEFPDAMVMIVGDGPELSRLKRLCQSLNISKSVIFTGWVPFNQIQYYIAACDIGVPLRSNNLGNNFVVTTALLQYWAVAKPIVAPRLTAVEDLIVDGEDGFLFDPNDSNMLANKIKQLLADNQLRQKFACIGKMKVERYAANEIAIQMVNTLEKSIQ